jgi:hypothetical protein
MSMADATPQDAPPDEGGAPAPNPSAAPRTAPPAPASPLLSAGWLLRATAFIAVAAAGMGVVVAPGMRGNAGEAVVDWVDRGASTFSYFLLLALLAVVGWGAFELVREREGDALPRLALVGSSAAVAALVLVGVVLHGRMARADTATVVTAAAAGVCALSGAYVSARAPHTRAAAVVLLALAFAALARIGAWEMAKTASERADLHLYGLSRGLSTAGVALEGLAQLAAVTWLGTRSKLAGQMGATAAVVAAFVLTWGVAKGVHSGAAPWQAVLHTALGDAAGVPPPYFLDVVAILLVPSSLLLALASAAQPGQVAAVVATVALALVSRGAFDAPLRALCAVAAAQWAALACRDERAMWRTLLNDRARRLADE